MFKKEDYEMVKRIQVIAKTRKDPLHKEVVYNCSQLILTRKITQENLSKILQVAFMYWTHVSKVTKPENQDSLVYVQALEIFNWATGIDLRRRMKITGRNK